MKPVHYRCSDPDERVDFAKVDLVTRKWKWRKAATLSYYELKRRFLEQLRNLSQQK